MSEEVFLESLGEQADAEIARILGEAAERTRRLLAEAESTASREEEERMQEAAIQAGLLRSRILNEARATERRIMLEAAHRIAGETLDEVARLAEGRVGGAEGPAILEALLSECLVEGNCRVCCRAEDREALEEIARRLGLQVKVEEQPIPSRGVVVVSDDGRFVQSNTLRERLRGARPALMRGIAASLAGLTGKGRSGA